MAHDTLINDIEQLFVRHGAEAYEGSRAEPLTMLEHALQCAQLAEWADADEALVAAALLHCVGQMLDDGTVPSERQTEARALAWLSEGFGDEVAEPIRLQSAARRYLRVTDAGFGGAAQAQAEGAMSRAEQLEFDALPQSARALRLCRLIEQAQGPIPRTPPLDYYLALLEDLQRQAADRDKLEVGPQTVS